MSPRHPQPLFGQATVAGDTQLHHYVEQPEMPLSEYLKTQSHSDEELRVMICLLETDQHSWDSIRQLRNTEMPFFLRRVLYQISDEVILRLATMRSDPEWDSIRIGAIEGLSTYLDGRPTSMVSLSSTNRLSTPSIQSITSPSSYHNSARNNGSTTMSTTPFQWSSLRTDFQDQTDQISMGTGSNSPSVALSPSPSLLKKIVHPHICKSRGCGMSFKRHGNLQNHVLKVHPESKQAGELKPQDPRHADKSLGAKIMSSSRRFQNIMRTSPHRRVQNLTSAPVQSSVPRWTEAHPALPYNSSVQYNPQQLLMNPTVANHFQHGGVQLARYDPGVSNFMPAPGPPPPWSSSNPGVSPPAQSAQPGLWVPFTAPGYNA